MLLLGQHVRWWPLELVVSQLPLLTLCVIGVLTITSLWQLRNRTTRRHAKRLVAAVSLIIGLIGHTLILQSPVPTTATNPIDTDTTIRYTTYNRLYKNPENDRIVEHLLPQNLDILSLQESRQSDIDFLQQRLGLPHATAANNEPKHPHGVSVALLSRYPIVSSDNLAGRSTWAEIIRSIIDVPQYGRIAVYTVHIYPPVSPSSYTNGLQAFDMLQQAIAAETLPTLVAGDFNTTVYSPKLRPLQSLLTLNTQSPVPRPSWHSLDVPLLQMRIDHIFHSSDFNLVSTDIGPFTGSDHRAVTSTLAY